MKISSQQVMATLKASKTYETAQSSRTDGVGRNQDHPYSSSLSTDGIQLSEQAEELVRLQKTLRGMSSVRQEKVEELKELIESGEYEVSADKVAEKIISRAAVNEVLSAEEG